LEGVRRPATSPQANASGELRRRSPALRGISHDRGWSALETLQGRALPNPRRRTAIRDIGAESFSQLCAARHSETLNTINVVIDEEGRLWADVVEPHVIYKSINDHTTWWARPEAMWSERTKTDVPRFRLLG
jgi:Protein of unknown function (DUF1653)